MSTSAAKDLSTDNTKPARKKGTLFARKGEAIPLVDKTGGAEAPEEVVAENRRVFVDDDPRGPKECPETDASSASDAATGSAGDAATGPIDETAPAEGAQESTFESDGEEVATYNDPNPSTALTIINERSMEAGYPDNPTPEEIEEIESEQAAIYGLKHFQDADDPNGQGVQSQPGAHPRSPFTPPSQRRAKQKTGFQTVGGEVGAHIASKDETSARHGDDALYKSEPDHPREASSAGMRGSSPLVGTPTAMVQVCLPLLDFFRLKMAEASLVKSENTIMVEALSAYFEREGIPPIESPRMIADIVARLSPEADQDT
ncbi:MAG: hypothetical protein AAFR03_09630 [Pseudomonadota bacterium]